MSYKEIIDKVSEDLGMNKGLVNRTYRAFWRAVREYISSLPLKEDLTEEEFQKLRPNVNIPSLGKLNVTLDRYNGMKKHYKICKEIKKEKIKKDNNAED